MGRGHVAPCLLSGLSSGIPIPPIVDTRYPLPTPQSSILLACLSIPPPSCPSYFVHCNSFSSAHSILPVLSSQQCRLAHCVSLPSPVFFLAGLVVGRAAQCFTLQRLENPLKNLLCLPFCALVDRSHPSLDPLPRTCVFPFNAFLCCFFSGPCTCCILLLTHCHSRCHSLIR